MSCIKRRLFASAGCIFIALISAVSASAADFDLTQTFAPDQPNSIFDSDGQAVDSTLTDTNGNAVQVRVSGSGRRPLSAVNADMAKHLNAFERDQGGDTYHISLFGDTGGASKGTVTYRFAALPGEAFAGSFSVAVQMAAFKIFSNTRSTVKVEYRFDNQSAWRTLQEQKAPQEGGVREPNVFDSFGKDQILTFDASGRQEVFVRLVMHSFFFPDNAQFYYARFRGRTEPAEKTETSSGQKGAGTAVPENLLKDPEAWQRYYQKERVRLKWNRDRNTLRVSSKQGRKRTVYRHKLALPGARIQLSMDFVGQKQESTAGGLMLYGVTTEGDQPLTVSVAPETETMSLGPERTSYRRLPENPYHYELNVVLGEETAKLFWGGRLRAQTRVYYEAAEGSVVVFATDGSIQVADLILTPSPDHAGSVAAARDYQDVTAPVSEAETVPLSSPFIEYFGTHYARTPDEVGIRFRTVRSYGGTHVGIPAEEEKRAPDSPVHEGPFTGEEVKVGLEDFHSQSRFARNPPTANKMIPELVEHDITSIYGTGTFMIDDDDDGLDTFQKDLAYWMIRQIHETWPGARDVIAWQSGNEIVGGHWNPKNLSKEEMRRDNSGEYRHSGYDLHWKLDYYINGFLGPAVEVLEKVGSDVYGDETALLRLTGSMNPYMDENVWWLRTLMDSRFTGDRAPTLKGDPVWKHIDVLTMHYMFDLGPGHQYGVEENRQRMDTYVKEYLRTGKVDGIWITEGHGRAGKGPVTTLETGFRFVDWVADHDLNADQARFIWWGEGERAGGSGQEMMRELGRFLKGADQLRYGRSEQDGIVFYTLVHTAHGAPDRVLVVVVPERADAVLNVDRFRLPLNSGNARWSVRAVQYSTLALPEEQPATVSATDDKTLSVALRHHIREPFVLFLSRK